MQQIASDTPDLSQGLAQPANQVELTPENFLKGLRNLHPEYKELPDDTLMKGWGTIHPEHADIVTNYFNSQGDTKTASKFSQFKDQSISSESQFAGQRISATPNKSVIDNIIDEVNPSIQTQAAKMGITPQELDKQLKKNRGQILPLVGGALGAVGGTAGVALGAGAGEAANQYINNIPGQQFKTPENSNMSLDPMSPIGKTVGTTFLTAGAIDGALKYADKLIKSGDVASAMFHIKNVLGLDQETGVVPQSKEELLNLLKNNKNLKPEEIKGINTQLNKIVNQEAVAGGGKLSETPVTTQGENQPNIKFQAPEQPTVQTTTQPVTNEQVQTPIETTPKESGILGNQSGATNPSAIASVPGKIATNVGNYIRNTSNQLQYSGNLENDLNLHITDGEADIIEARQAIDKTPVESKADNAAVHHYEDAVSAGITPPTITPMQQALYQAELPIKQESEKLYELIRQNGIHIENPLHTSHIVLGKGSIIDKLENFGTQGSNATGGGLLSQSASSLKKRTMYALTDESGNRAVANIEGGKVAILKNGVRTELGSFDLKKNIDLLKGEIEPIQTGMNKLKKTLSVLDSVNTRSPLPQGRINLLRKRVADLGTGLMEALGKGENIDKFLSKQAKNTVSKSLLELKAYTRVRPTEDVVLRDARMATLKIKIEKSERIINNIINSYDLDKLEDKVFVDNTGKKWKVSPTTTKEVSANTNLRYSEHSLANNILTNLSLKRAYKAIQLLDSWKKSPDFQKIAIKDGTQMPIPDWHNSKWPQLRGYSFEPHTREVLDNFYEQANRGRDLTNIVSAINRIAIRGLFLNPFTASYHVFNEGGHWFGDRGLTPWIPLMGNYKTLASTMNKAMIEVITLGPVYKSILRAGGNLNLSRTQEPLLKALAKKCQIDLTKNPTLTNIMAKRIGVPAAELLNSVSTMSSKAIWFANDFFITQRVLERMEHGLSMEEAIKETTKHIPDQIIPTHVLGQKWLGKFLSNPNFEWFARYHYGMMKDWGNLIKDASNGLIANLRNIPPQAKAKATKDSLHALNGLAAIAVLYGMITAYKKAAEKISGNPRAYGRYFGPTAIPKAISDVATGRKTVQEASTTVLTPAAGSKALVELIFNRNLYTGKKVYDPETLLQDASGHVMNQLGNSEVKVAQGKKSMREYLSSFLEINTPKMTDYERRLYDHIYNDRDTTRIKVENMILAKKGKDALDIMSKYNHKLIDLTQKSFKDEGKPIPTVGKLVGNKTFKNNLLQVPSNAVLRAHMGRQGVDYVSRLFIRAKKH